MAKNRIKEVAKLLGLELEEEFKMGENELYKFTVNGLMFWSDCHQTWVHYDITEQLLLGRREIIKLPKPILDDVEKKYLSNIITPFRNRILYIAKAETVKTYGNPNAKTYECIYIMYKDSSKKQNPFYMGFPCFEKGTMYKGMELNKEYTLDELGL